MSSSPTTPVPIVLCGATTVVGKPVAEVLKPEFEVVHFIQTIGAAVADLPFLLAGKNPPNPASDSVATHNYSNPPRAVVLGRAFTPQEVEDLREKCQGINMDPIVWLAGDPAKKPTGTVPPPNYAETVGREVKSLLQTWLASTHTTDELMFF